MQVFTNPGRLHSKTILSFLLILFIAFLPVSTFLFFIKNDAFNNYFPPKFFMSESLHSGYLPLWNPYINYGFPQYGDMNSGFWSPITWLIASTVGYNAYTFTIEVLFYILIGGIGMYQLSGIWVANNRVRMIAGVAFMCCGYNVGHLQHFNWLSGAAFLPWCLWSYLLLIRTFSVQRVLQTALLLYLLMASAHPGIIISAAYFFTAVLIYTVFKSANNKSVNNIKQVGISHLILLGIMVPLSAGIIAGYSDIIPHFLRGEKISLMSSLDNPTNIQSWISALLPFATVKNDSFYETDPTMRNCYFGLTFLLFFLLACARRKDQWQKFLLITGILFALLAAGGIFKTFAYKFVPLVGYVRLNGEFRIFALLCFILLASIELDKFIRQNNRFKGSIVWIYYLVEIVVIAGLIFGTYQARATRQGFMFDLSNLSEQGLLPGLKALIDAVSFYDTFWIQGSVQLLFLWGLKWCIKEGDTALLQRLTIANLIIATLLNLPYTGVGKASVHQLQAVLNKSPAGITIPLLQPINKIDTLSKDETDLTGNWSMYSKQVGVKEEVPYAIILKNMRTYFDEIKTNADNGFTSKPFLFTTSNKIYDSIKINSFSPTKIRVSVFVQEPSKLVLQQNFYPYWYYQNGTEIRAMNKYGTNFMDVPVRAGGNDITVFFDPVWIKRMMLLSAVSFIVCCIWLFVSRFKQPSPL